MSVRNPYFHLFAKPLRAGLGGKTCSIEEPWGRGLTQLEHVNVNKKQFTLTNQASPWGGLAQLKSKKISSKTSSLWPIWPPPYGNGVGGGNLMNLRAWKSKNHKNPDFDKSHRPQPGPHGGKLVKVKVLPLKSWFWQVLHSPTRSPWGTESVKVKFYHENVDFDKSPMLSKPDLHGSGNLSKWNFYHRTLTLTSSHTPSRATWAWRLLEVKFLPWKSWFWQVPHTPIRPPWLWNLVKVKFLSYITINISVRITNMQVDRSRLFCVDHLWFLIFTSQMKKKYCTRYIYYKNVCAFSETGITE
jgi:hypothetical protein